MIRLHYVKNSILLFVCFLFMIMNNLYIIDFTSIHYIKIEEIKSRHNTCMIIKLEETHFTILLAFEKLIISFSVLSIFLEISKEFIL